MTDTSTSPPPQMEDDAAPRKTNEDVPKLQLFGVQPDAQSSYGASDVTPSFSQSEELRARLERELGTFTAAASVNGGRPNSTAATRGTGESSHHDQQGEGYSEQGAPRSYAMDKDARRQPSQSQDYSGSDTSPNGKRHTHSAPRSRPPAPPGPPSHSPMRSNEVSRTELSRLDTSPQRQRSMRRSHSTPGMRKRSNSPSDTPTHRRMTKSASRANTERSPSRSGFAGYKPPDTAVDEIAIERASGVMRDPEALDKLLSQDSIIEACAAAGIPPEELKPRPKSAFRHEVNRAEVLSPETQEKRFNHFENRRLWKLAIVLTQASNKEERDAARMQQEPKMLTVIDSVVQQERSRQARISEARMKVVTVLERENELIKDRRAEFDDRQVEAQRRYEKILASREEEQRRLAERANQREIARAALQERRDADSKRKILRVMEASQAREAKVQEFLEVKKAMDEQERLSREAAQKRREQSLHEARAREEARRQELEQRLATKTSNIEAIREAREKELSLRSEEQRLRQQSRMDNAERIRRMAANEKSKTIQKMAASYERMEQMRELREAVIEERRRYKKEQIIQEDGWKASTVLERNLSPGPGEYSVPSTLTASGGTWGKHKPKSDVEWQMYRAAQIPGPGEYALPSSVVVPGGTWGKHKPKSDVEWQMYRAAQIPGPGQYQPRSLAGGAAVRFGDHNPPSDLDRAIKRAAESPGPGQYAGQIMPLERRSLNEIAKSTGRPQTASAFRSPIRTSSPSRGNSPSP